MQEPIYDTINLQDLISKCVAQTLASISPAANLDKSIGSNAIQDQVHAADQQKGEDPMAKRYKERVQIGVNADGTPIYNWATGATTQEMLLNAASMLRDAGILPQPATDDARKHLFKPYAERWFETFKRPTIEENTAVTYSRQMNNHLFPAFGALYIEDITPEDIQAFFNERAGLAKDTQQKHKNLLRMIFDSAVEDGIITTNPAKSRKVKLTGRAFEERQPLSREAMQDVIASIPHVVDITDRCFIALQALHGMRPCEVLGLQWGDISLQKNEIHIQRDVVHPHRHHPIVTGTKTPKSNRTIPISAIALPYILEAAKLAQADEHPDHFVFGGEQPITYCKHRNMMKRVCKQMGISQVTGYTFRHTVLTDIYENTHDANIAAAVAGHSKTSMTMDRYAHARQDSSRRGISALDMAYSM